MRVVSTRREGWLRETPDRRDVLSRPDTSTGWMLREPWVVDVPAINPGDRIESCFSVRARWGLSTTSGDRSRVDSRAGLPNDVGTTLIMASPEDLSPLAGVVVPGLQDDSATTVGQTVTDALGTL